MLYGVRKRGGEEKTYHNDLGREVLHPQIGHFRAASGIRKPPIHVVDLRSAHTGHEISRAALQASSLDTNLPCFGWQTIGW